MMIVDRKKVSVTKEKGICNVHTLAGEFDIYKIVATNRIGDSQILRLCSGCLSEVMQKGAKLLLDELLAYEVEEMKYRDD